MADSKSWSFRSQKNKKNFATEFLLIFKSISQLKSFTTYFTIFLTLINKINYYLNSLLNKKPPFEYRINFAQLLTDKKNHKWNLKLGSTWNFWQLQRLARYFFVGIVTNELKKIPING